MSWNRKRPEPLPDERPKHVKRASRKRKRFGIEHYCKWFKKWGAWKWYLTEEQRDQALADLIKHTPAVFRRPGHPTPEETYRKVERE